MRFIPQSRPRSWPLAAQPAGPLAGSPAGPRSRRRFLAGGAVGSAAVALAACGGAPTAGPAPASPASGAAKAPFTLVIFPMHAMDPVAEGQERGYLQTFTQQHPQITVELLNFPGESYPAKNSAMIAAGTAPDVFGPHSRTDFMVKGVFLKLNDRLDKDKALDIADFYPASVDFYSHDGFMRGRGTNRVGLGYTSGAGVLYYNKAAFAKAGAETPQQALDKKQWTYDKLLELATATTKRTGDTVEQYGLNWGEIWGPRVWSYGGDFLSADAFTAQWGSAISADALQWHQDLRHKHRVNPLPTETAVTFQSGTLAMQTSDSGLSAKLGQVSFEWDVVPLPAGPKGVFHRYYSLGVGVYSRSPHVDEAYELMRYYTSKDVQTSRLKDQKVLTTRRSVGEGPAMKAWRPPEHSDAYITSATTARTWPESAASADWLATPTPWTDLANGLLTGKEAGMKADAAFQPFLDKMKAGGYGGALPEFEAKK